MNLCDSHREKVCVIAIYYLKRRLLVLYFSVCCKNM